MTESGAWRRVAALSELEENEPRGVVVDGVPVVLVRDADAVHALHDMCTHERIPLSEGEVFDGEIECWLHGSTFELSTGKPTCLPATEPATVYPVRIEGDDVYVAVTEVTTQAAQRAGGPDGADPGES